MGLYISQPTREPQTPSNPRRMSNPQPVQQSALVDGYISHSFTPLEAERYFYFLQKSKAVTFYPASYSPGTEGAFFFVPSVPQHISVQFPAQSRWVLDRGVVDRGTVVPQTLWAPHTITDKRNHVEDAVLQLPIFFQRTDGHLGLTLEAAAAGRCHGLVGAQDLAPLGNKSTTHIRIVWPGCVEFKRQVQIRDETSQRNPITTFRFAYHIGRSVDAFFRSFQVDAGRPNPRWRIGVDGIRPSEIVIIGAVHVSAGSWMPILQLNRYVFCDS